MTTTADHLRDYLVAIAGGGDLGANYLLENAQAFTVKRNEELPFGEAKNCYGNATNAVLFQPDDRYQYVEGFVQGHFPVRHAWVLDTTDGTAVDVTLRFGLDTCGFCNGEGRRPLDDHSDCELCDGDGEEYGCEADEVCALIDGVDAGCHGTGKSDTNLPWNPDRAYVGVVIPKDVLREVLIKTGTYGVLDKPLYYDLIGECIT